MRRRYKCDVTIERAKKKEFKIFLKSFFSFAYGQIESSRITSEKNHKKPPNYSNNNKIRLLSIRFAR